MAAANGGGIVAVKGGNMSSAGVGVECAMGGVAAPGVPTDLLYVVRVNAGMLDMGSPGSTNTAQALGEAAGHFDIRVLVGTVIGTAGSSKVGAVGG